MASKSARRKFFKSRSRQILYNDWLTHVFAFLIVGSMSFGFKQFGASISILVQELTDNVFITALLFSIFLVLEFVFFIPVLIGYMYFEQRCLERGKASLSDLFYAFENTYDFTRSYKITLYATLKSVVYFIPAIALDYFLNNVYHEGIFNIESSFYGKDAVYFLLSVILIVFTSIGFVFCTKNIVGIYVCLIRNDTEISKCFFIANLCISQSKRELAMLTLSFLPLALLSLFTLGFLFIMYTIPYIAICLTMFCKYLYDKEMYCGNIKKVLYSQNQTDNNPERK